MPVAAPPSSAPPEDRSRPALAGRRQLLDQAVPVVQRLAHDFGNYLTSLQGFAELAQGQLPRESPAAEHLTQVLRAARDAARFTDRLRLLSRRGPARAHAACLAAVAAVEAGRLRGAWGPAVRLTVQVAEDLPPVRLDGELLREVLCAVLENAREAITGTGTVTLTARRAALTEADCPELLGNPAPGPCVEVIVSDTGCGLGPEVQCRLLTEPFFTSKPGHRGLGLAVVHGILHAHRGGFRLDPAPGQGAVGRLFLPTAPDLEGRALPRQC